MKRCLDSPPLIPSSIPCYVRTAISRLRAVRQLVALEKAHRATTVHAVRVRAQRGLDRTNELFKQFLNDITPTDKMIKLFDVIVRRIAKEKLSYVNKSISDVRNSMTKIDNDMQKALQSMLDGDISKQEKEDYQSSLRIKRLDLEDELNKLRDIQSLNEATITYVCNFMNTPARMWQDADAETKVIFQRMVTENGIEFDLKNEKFGTEGLSMFYRLKDTQKDAEASLDSYMVTSPGIEPGLPG